MLYARIYAERDCWFFMAAPDSHQIPARWVTMHWFAMVFALGGIVIWDLSTRLFPTSIALQIPTWAVATAGLVLGVVTDRAITPHEDVQFQHPQLIARYKAPRERVKTWLIVLGVPLLLTILAVMIRE
jgi:hypothetical protein